MIGADGHVERMHLVSGHRLLAPAAMQAVRQWVFEPTQVDGTCREGNRRRSRFRSTSTRPESR